MPDDLKTETASPDAPKPVPKPSAKKGKETPPAPAQSRQTDRARVCHENDRAPASLLGEPGGLRRFRVRAIDADRPLGLYILAPDAASAKACYLAAEKFPTEPAKIDIVELPD